MLNRLTQVFFSLLAVLAVSSVAFAQDASPLLVGETVSGTLSGSADVYIIMLEKGDVLLLELEGLESNYLQVFTPENVVFSDDSYYGIDEKGRLGFLATRAGEYRISVGDSFSEGNYTLLATSIEPLVSATLEFDKVFSNVVTDLQTQLSFTLAEDTTVTIVFEAPSYSINVSLLNDTGATVSTGGYNSRLLADLTAGTYVVTVDPSFGRASELDNPFYALVLSSITKQTLTYGEVASVDLTDEKIGFFEFAGTEGDIINIVLDNEETYSASFTVRDPNEIEIAYSDNSGVISLVKRFELPSTGTYRVEVTPYSTAFATPFTLLVEQTDSLPLTVEPLAITFTEAQTFEVFTLAVEAGKTYRLTITNDDATRYYDAIVVDEMTQVISLNSNGTKEASAVFEASSTGIYTVTLRSSYYYDAEKATANVSVQEVE